MAVCITGTKGKGGFDREAYEKRGWSKLLNILRMEGY